MTETIFEAIQTALLLGGAIWAYIKLRTRREHHPRVEFEVDINLIGSEGDRRLVELVARIDNKGFVRQEIAQCAFEFSCIRLNAARDSNDDASQVYFPHKIASGSWIRREGSYLFTEPGVQRTYSRVYNIPRDATFLRLSGVFLYATQRDRNTEHSSLTFAQIWQMINSNPHLEFEEAYKVCKVDREETSGESDDRVER